MSNLIYCQEQLHTYADLMPPSSRPRDIWAALQTYLLTHTNTGNNDPDPHLGKENTEDENKQDDIERPIDDER